MAACEHLTSLRVHFRGTACPVPISTVERLTQLRELQLTQHPGAIGMDPPADIVFAQQAVSALASLRQLRRVALHGLSGTREQADALLAQGAQLWQAAVWAHGWEAGDRRIVPFPSVWAAAT